MIGWCLYVPQLSTLNTKPDLRDGEVQLDLILGPGMTIFGDVLWDQQVARGKDKKLYPQILTQYSFVKMAVHLSSQEEPPREPGAPIVMDKHKQEEEILKKAQEQMKVQL